MHRKTGLFQDGILLQVRRLFSLIVGFWMNLLCTKQSNISALLRCEHKTFVQEWKFKMIVLLKCYKMKFQFVFLIITFFWLMGIYFHGKRLMVSLSQVSISHYWQHELKAHWTKKVQNWHFWIPVLNPLSVFSEFFFLEVMNNITVVVLSTLWFI